jgi:hypothetical protein
MAFLRRNAMGNKSMWVERLKKKVCWPIVLSVSVLLVGLFTEKTYSSGVPEEPILRIEMGMHSAWITCIAVDPQNRSSVSKHFT